jgi:hypothetical protein
MNSENIKKVINQASEQLITALNQGRSEKLTQYLAAIGPSSLPKRVSVFARQEDFGVDRTLARRCHAF